MLVWSCFFVLNCPYFPIQAMEHYRYFSYLLEHYYLFSFCLYFVYKCLYCLFVFKSLKKGGYGFNSPYLHCKADNTSSDYCTAILPYSNNLHYTSYSEYLEFGLWCPLGSYSF